MMEKSVTIQLANGLEARPMALLVQIASKYESRICLQTNEKKVNAKSIMGMMSLGLAAGEKITVTADGDDKKDEEAAIEEITNYLSGKVK